MPEITWKDAELLHEWDDGIALRYVFSREDMKTLGLHGGGCAPDHAFWTEASDPIGEYFFTLGRDGDPSSILFCKNELFRGKKHPQDGEPFEAYCRKYGIRSWIKSDYYERYGPIDYGLDYDLQEYQSDVDAAKRRYEKIKAQAQAQGPLGKTNPLNVQMNDANRKKNAAKGRLEDYLASKKVRPGQSFVFRGVPIYIIQNAGKGSSYGSTGSRYGDKWVEFMSGVVGKE